MLLKSNGLIILTLLFFGVFISGVAGQNTQVHWGPNYKLKGGSDHYKFLGIQNDRYYFVLKPDRDNLLLEYDLNHKLISEYKFDHVVNKERFKIHGAIQTKSGSYIYMHQLLRKSKEWVLNISEMKEGKFSKPREAYFQKFNVSTSKLSQVYRDYEYDYGLVDGGLIMNEDSTKVAFVNVFPAKNYRKDDMVAFAVFDDAMNLLWKKVFYYKFGEKNYEITQKVVTNDGEIYLVAKVDKANSMDKIQTIKEKNLPSYDYFLYHVNQEGILESRVELGSNYAPMDVGLFFPDKNSNQFLMSGFYTDDEHKFRLKGMFFSYGDKNFTEKEIKIHAFDPVFLEDLIGEKAIKKGKGLNSTFQIKDILNYEDGSIGFIAENYYERYDSRRDVYGRFYQQVEYISSDIIIPKFDVRGNLLNIEKIDKYYTSYSKSDGSYSLALARNKTYLVFNDFKSRREAKEIDKKGRRFTDLVVLDKEGKIERHETLFSNAEIDYEFNPELTDYNKNIFLIGTKYGNRFSMATINLD